MKVLGFPRGAEPWKFICCCVWFAKSSSRIASSHESGCPLAMLRAQQWKVVCGAGGMLGGTELSKTTRYEMCFIRRLHQSGVGVVWRGRRGQWWYGGRKSSSWRSLTLKFDAQISLWRGGAVALWLPSCFELNSDTCQRDDPRRYR